MKTTGITIRISHLMPDGLTPFAFQKSPFSDDIVELLFQRIIQTGYRFLLIG